MKIAVVQPRLSYFNGGGEKIPLDSIANSINLVEDVTFSLFTTKPPIPYSGTYIDFKNKYLGNSKIDIVEIPVPTKFKYLYDIMPGEDRLRWDIESIYFNNLVHDSVIKAKPDVVLSYYLPDYVFQVPKIPSILYLLGYPRTDSEYREAMIAQYDRVISISRTTLDQWNNHLKIKIDSNTILHQGVDLTKIPSKITKFESSIFNIVFAGRLIERKGLLTLLEAICLLARDKSNFKLYILGEGPMHATVLDFINDNNLNDKVSVEGFKDNVVDYLSSANLCVFPSYAGEGLMNVVLESLYFNGMVISTNGNGNEEAIINGDNGYLIDPHDPRALKNKIQQIMDNPNDKHMREKAKLTISKEFSWIKHAEELRELCREVINGKAS